MIYKYIIKDEMGNDIVIAFDAEKVEIVKNNIIDNCSIIKHCSEKFDERTVYLDIVQKQKQNNSIIKNVRCVDDVVAYKSLGEYYFHEYTYDEYIPLIPEVVEALDNIINNRPAIVDYILKPEKVKMREYNAYGDIEMIKQLLDEYLVTNNKSKLEMAKNLLNQHSRFTIEGPKESISNYYNELHNCYILENANIIKENVSDINSNLDEEPKKK